MDLRARELAEAARAGRWRSRPRLRPPGRGDIRLYSGATFRAANLPVHPLDFRATVAQIEEVLAGYGERLGDQVDLRETLTRTKELRDALETLYAEAGRATSIEAARPVNDALIRIGRALVSVLYSSAGRFRQDPALDIPLLPEFAAAADAVGTAPAGVVRTEATRARNRLDHALDGATEAARAP